MYNVRLTFSYSYSFKTDTHHCSHSCTSARSWSLATTTLSSCCLLWSCPTWPRSKPRKSMPRFSQRRRRSRTTKTRWRPKQPSARLSCTNWWRPKRSSSSNRLSRSKKIAPKLIMPLLRLLLRLQRVNRRDRRRSQWVETARFPWSNR